MDGLRKLTPDAKTILLVRRGGVDAAAPLKPKSASPENVRRNPRVRVAPTRAAKTKTAKTRRFVPIAGTSAKSLPLGSNLSSRVSSELLLLIKPIETILVPYKFDFFVRLDTR